MHQPIDTVDERAIIWADWEAYLDGWIDAEKGEPCLPPHFYPFRRKQMYVAGWSTKHAIMLKGG